MRAVVVYESMFGNTHAIAEAVAKGLATGNEVKIVPVGEALRLPLEGVDLVVVGGPTHARGMSRRGTRRGAPGMAEKSGGALVMDPGANGPGVREWLASLGRERARAAAFDTRIKGPAVLAGRASRGIARGLRRHGFHLVAKPESFLVDGKSKMVDGELERARSWGEHLSVELGLERYGSAA